MKRIMLILLLCLFLISCSKNHSNDEYFIHAVGFSEEDGKLVLHAVFEKQSEDDKDYFLVKQSGKSLDSITKKIRKNYKQSYFATCEIYYFSSSLSESSKLHLAVKLIESNIYPLKSKAVEIAESEYMKTLADITDEDALKKALKQNKKSPNVALYLCSIMEG